MMVFCKNLSTIHGNFRNFEIYDLAFGYIHFVKQITINLYVINFLIIKSLCEKYANDIFVFHFFLF